MRLQRSHPIVISHYICSWEGWTNVTVTRSDLIPILFQKEVCHTMEVSQTTSRCWKSFIIIMRKIFIFVPKNFIHFSLIKISNSNYREKIQYLKLSYLAWSICSSLTPKLKKMCWKLWNITDNKLVVIFIDTGETLWTTGIHFWSNAKNQGLNKIRNTIVYCFECYLLQQRIKIWTWHGKKRHTHIRHTGWP